METAGQTLTDEQKYELVRLWTVVAAAAAEPFTVKSRFARKAAQYVAIAASMGLITVRLDEELFAPYWMITDEGDEWLIEGSIIFNDQITD